MTSTRPSAVQPLIGLGLVLVLSAYARAGVTTVAWYRLGENDPGAGLGVMATNTTDLVGFENLRQIGQPVYFPAATAAQTRVDSSLALHFVTGQYLSNGIVSLATNNFGIEAWAQPDTTSGAQNRNIAYNGTLGSSGSTGWGIFQNHSSYFGVLGGGFNVGSGTATAGTWTHLALVRNNGLATFYVDGAATGGSINTPAPPSAGSFSIATAPQSGQSFNGAVDEVRVFTFAPGQFSTNDLLVNLQLVATLPATGTRYGITTLNGTLYPPGLPTFGWFQWGLTTNYGNATAQQSFDAAAGSTNFSQSLTGIAGAATYQFRTVVSNALGLAFGTNLSITIPPPPLVTTTNDSGPGSLRQVIADASGGDTVTFATNVTGMILLTNGELMVNKPLSIVGPGANQLTIRGDSPGHSVFEFSGGPSVVSGLTILLMPNYMTFPQAGITNNASLTVNGCVIVGFQPGLWHNQGTLTLLNSTLYQNTQGLLVNTGSVALVTNCTFFQNALSGSGGAINNNGTLILRSCSIGYNNATDGGGIWNGGSIDIGNTIVALNQAYGFTTNDQDVAGSFVSSGFNLIGQSDGSSGFANGVKSDQVGSNASPINPFLVNPPVDFTGPTPVLNVGKPSTGFNPVFDRGYSFGSGADQRGRIRPFKLASLTNAPGGDGSDIGAVEFGAPPLCSACNTQIVVDTSRALRPVDGRWFGINTAAWDGSYDTPQTLSALREIGCRILRYPGGGYADTYHWTNNSVQGSSSHPGTPFANFIHTTTNLGAQAFITVNYGTGTTNEAADWVRSANITNHCGFKYWEIGNENYFAIEADSNNVPPFQPHDPWTYATRFRDYFNAMKAADPTIKVGAVATTFDDISNAGQGAVNPRTGQYHNGWNPVMLSTLNSLGITPDFIIHHVYPEGRNDDDALVLQASYNWQGDAAFLRQQLKDYLGDNSTNVELLCTENNSDAGTVGKQSTSLVNALYLADSMSQIMKTEIGSYLWWDLRNGQSGPASGGDFVPVLYGWRSYGDFGLMFGATTRYPTYYAMKLMHYFAQPGDIVLECGNTNLLLSTYAARQTSGSLTLLAINKDRYNTITNQISLLGLLPNSTTMVRSYGILQDEATRTNGPAAMQDIATNTVSVFANFSYVFPPYSLTLFTFSPAPPSLALSASAPGSALIFSLQGQPGVRYVIQTSSNLVQWQALQTNTLASPALSITSTIQPGVPAAFWRAVWMP